LKRLRVSRDFAEVGWRVPLTAVGVPQPNAHRELPFPTSGVITDARWEWILERLARDHLGHVGKPRSRLRTDTPVRAKLSAHLT